MNLLDPPLLADLTVHIPPPGQGQPRAYLEQVYPPLTPAEIAYVVPHLIGQVLETCRALGWVCVGPVELKPVERRSP